MAFEEATSDVKPLSTPYEQSFLHSYAQKHTYTELTSQLLDADYRNTQTHNSRLAVMSHNIHATTAEDFWLVLSTQGIRASFPTLIIFG